jgi:hypothetical protein
MARENRGAWLWIALIAICQAGCASPKDALKQYLDALNQGDYVQAFGLISSKDKQVKDFQAYMSESSSQRSALRLALASKVSYSIKSAQKKGDQATVSVDLNTPDFDAVYAEIFGSNLGGAKADRKAINRLLAETYKKTKMPMLKTNQAFTLYKEEDGWKVFLDWEKEKKVEDIIAQGEQLEKDGDWQAAKDKFEEALKLDSSNGLAGLKVKEIDAKVVAYQSNMEYAPNIAFGNIKVEKAFGGTAVILDIKNNGGRALKMVEVIVSFLDKEGQPISQKFLKPIDAQPGVTQGEDAPLGPGQKRAFGMRMDAPPAGWSGKVDIKVNNLEFAE